jgi:hypothetical protein
MRVSGAIDLLLRYNFRNIFLASNNGRATSPVGRLVFKTNETLKKRLVGSTPTPSAIFF